MQPSKELFYTILTNSEHAKISFNIESGNFNAHDMQGLQAIMV